ncbi:hypothetical protein ES702_01189 [subsurface metagenome]
MKLDRIIKFAKKDRFWYAEADAFLQSCLGFTHGFVKSQRIFPVYIKHFIFSLKDGHGYQAVDIDDAKKASDYFISLWEKDKNIYNKIEKKWRNAEKRQNKIIAELEKTNLRKLSDRKLFSLYLKMLGHSIDVWSYLGIPEAIGIYEEHILPNKVKKKLKINEKDYTEIAVILSFPQKESFTKKYEESIGNIKKTIEQGKNPKQLIKEHIKKYYWIRSGYHAASDLTKNEVLKEVKEHKTKHGKTDVDRNLIIKKYQIPQKIIDLFDFISLMAYWRDERKRASLPVIYWIFKLCDDIARRKNVDYKIIYNLSLDDFRNYLVGEKKIPSYVSAKGNFSFYMGKEPGVKYFYGNEHKKIFEAYFGKKKKATKKIIGTVVSKTDEVKIKGVVRVIHNPIGAKFKKGEILVTAMTRPEFVPLMKKASAVITDQGGLTCHAAIVSRELGVPCIIGTKIATKVLKDGDQVEVDANKGIVKIIKRAK